MRPRASVVIPSYNHACFIEEAVTSVLDAPVDDLELILVDDGSEDDTLERLERFRGDPRLTIHSQENRGAHAALNRGVEASRGEIVFILNSDDAFAERRIPLFLERFERQPRLTILASWIQVVDAAGKPLGVKQGYFNMQPWPRPRPGPNLAATGDLALALLETNYVSTTSNVAFRRRLFEDGVRFQPLRYAHDWDFLLAACAAGELDLVEEPLVSYRVHGENTIREGESQDLGQGQMRFEILWAVARHALRLLRARAARGHDPEDLRRRMWNGLPRFGYESILAQLLTMRGPDDEPPAAYDALLEERHPFRRAAIQVLAAS